jgi:hypothetical protein
MPSPGKVRNVLSGESFRADTFTACRHHLYLIQDHA